MACMIDACGQWYLQRLLGIRWCQVCFQPSIAILPHLDCPSMTPLPGHIAQLDDSGSAKMVVTALSAGGLEEATLDVWNSLRSNQITFITFWQP